MFLQLSPKPLLQGTTNMGFVDGGSIVPVDVGPSVGPV